MVCLRSSYGFLRLLICLLIVGLGDVFRSISNVTSQLGASGCKNIAASLVGGLIGNATFPMTCPLSVGKGVPTWTFITIEHPTTSEKTTLAQVPPGSSDTHPYNYPICVT